MFMGGGGVGGEGGEGGGDGCGGEEDVVCEVDTDWF